MLTWFEEKGVVTVDSVDKEGKAVGYEKAEELGIEADCEQVRLSLSKMPIMIFLMIFITYLDISF